MNQDIEAGLPVVRLSWEQLNHKMVFLTMCILPLNPPFCHRTNQSTPAKIAA
jgi:hypothetical protein